MDATTGAPAAEERPASVAARLPAFVDRAAPWLLASVVFAVSLASYQDSWRPELVAGATFAAVSSWLARNSLVPLFVVAVGGWVLLGMWPALVVSAYYAGTSLHGRRLILTFAGAATAVVVVPAGLGVALDSTRWSTRTVADVLILLGAFVFVPLVVGLWVDARRQVVAGLHERALQAEREQQIRAETARGEERARIAREMHDVVAHQVTRMVLRAGALEVSAPDAKTAEAAAAIRITGREALADLRQVLGVLRTRRLDDVLTPQPVLADLDALLDAARETGVDVTRRDEGEARRLPDTVERAVCRIVQEALLNVRKHAPGASTEVVLRHHEETVGVEVSNGPPPDNGDADEALPHSGFGLVGLTERVQLLGGTLEAAPRPDGGFVVRATLPTSETRPEEEMTVSTVDRR
jgi:signal transduction histidine kinase